MPGLVNIFVEGVADLKFLSDYISYIAPAFGIIKDETLIDTKGWTSILSKKDRGGGIRSKMEENTNRGFLNLVIFDADNDFIARKNEIDNWRKQYGLTFELFLFPNNQDSGALEDLLEKIIIDKNQSIFDCWNRYEKCLQSKEIEGRAYPLTTPTKKTKIYGYLEALLGTSKEDKKKIKEQERDYTNNEHWNLDADYLIPLKEFLLLHIQ
ncbi:hypothetical protein Barb4_02079 [Bacteroidales bacterium Barb4]|nr:hypothetical protein Barb4_02079 [Bacteroidales bacterium Barb4]